MWPESRRKTLVSIGPEPPVWYFLACTRGAPAGVGHDKVCARCGDCRGVCCRVGGGYAPARADVSPSLQSFGTSKAISAYELSATGVTGYALQPDVAAAMDFGRQAGKHRLWRAADACRLCSSTMLTPTLALDSGYGLDIAARFSNYDGDGSPFLTPVNAPYLGLANGGRYAGVTFVPASNLRVRLGSSINSERLDSFHFDPAAPTGNLGLTYDASQTRSLLGGVSWDVTSALGLDVTGISADPLRRAAGLRRQHRTPRQHQCHRRFRAHEHRRRLGHHRIVQRRHDPAGPERQLAPGHAARTILCHRHRQAWPVRR